jgi:integrase
MMPASKAFGRLVKAAGLPRITLHQVRHSFATIALEQGIDVLYVSELLGHSSAAITQTDTSTRDPKRSGRPWTRSRRLSKAEP